MRSIIRKIAINSFALWTTAQLIDGFRIHGGWDIILGAGLALTIINFILKPILKLLSLPLLILTMGFFMWILNAIMLYILTFIVPEIVISTTHFVGFSFNGIIIPKFTLSPLPTAIVVGGILSFIEEALYWIFEFK